MEEGEDQPSVSNAEESAGNSLAAQAGDSSLGSSTALDSAWMTSMPMTSSMALSTIPISNGPRHNPALFRLPEGTLITDDFIREQHELLAMAVQEGDRRLVKAEEDHAQKPIFVSSVDCI